MKNDLLTVKRLIVGTFHYMYGFAPARTAIIPLELNENGEGIKWIAFRVENKGYTYDVETGVINFNNAYDA